jgi:hypothetical protein
MITSRRFLTGSAKKNLLGDIAKAVRIAGVHYVTRDIVKAVFRLCFR